MEPQTEPDRRAGLPTGNAGTKAPVRTAGRAGVSMVSFPALPAVALQGGPVRHMSIRSSATGIPASVRMKPGVAQFPRPGPEQVPVPARMSGQALVSNNIRGALPIRETGKPDAGHNIHARLPRHRTRSGPGNNGVAPGEQDGTGKTGSPDRHRDLPDLIRRTDPGFQGTGTSGGRRPISGLRAGPERVPSREGFFCRWPCRTSRHFFHRRYRANSGATPPAVSPRVSGGHFVSAGRAISFQMTRRKKFPEWLQPVVGGANPKRNEMQKNRHAEAEVGKCGT